MQQELNDEAHDFIFSKQKQKKSNLRAEPCHRSCKADAQRPEAKGRLELEYVLTTLGVPERERAIVLDDPHTAPELCIEILSPKDTLTKALEKAKNYIAWESRCVWIFDPEKRTAWTLSKEESEPAWISPN